MVRPLGGVHGRLLPPNGRVQPHHLTDRASFHTFSHLSGSLEAAGTRPLTEILENSRGAGRVGRVRVPSHPRSVEDRLGGGLKLRPIYCVGTSYCSVASFSRSAVASDAAARDRAANANLLAARRLVDAISCFKPAPCTDAPRTSLGALKAQMSLPLTLERQCTARAGSCASLSHGVAKNVTASRAKCLNLRRCQREDRPGSRPAWGAAGLANTHQKRTGTCEACS